MPNIQINIKEKVARGDGTIIVCGNSDYVAHFDFDSEWDEYTTKTAHFEWGGKYEDRIFTGNECAVPVVYGVNALTVGVFAGDIRSTTPAFFKCVPCSQDSNSIPADPTPDVYNQLMELLNKDSGVWYPAVDDAGNMSWTRSMSETEPQPVNIKGPKGDAGADGVGIPGTDGKDGVDGKSAYELAQDNGFQGTMQEWLASLVGADGANGVDGNDGISPTVSVAAITGGNRVTITDAEGAKTFDVMDGAQGASGADGKDYVLTDTDKQEIAEAAAGFVDVPSVQHDWNQNDSTAADYIKNRPFYTGDPVKTALVEEQTVAFSDMDGVYAIQGWPTNFDAVVGETYTVSWDGTVYECECLSMQSIPYIGNLAIAGAEIDTGEPFIFMNQGAWVVAANDTASEHIIEISSIEKQIIKVDEQYLPIATNDSVGAVKDNNYVFDLTKEQTKETVKEWLTIADNAKNNLYYKNGDRLFKIYKVRGDYNTHFEIYEDQFYSITYRPNDSGVYDWADGESCYHQINTSSVYFNDSDINSDIGLEIGVVLGFDVKNNYYSYCGLESENIIAASYLQGNLGLVLKQYNGGKYYKFTVDANDNIIVGKYSPANTKVISKKLLATTDSSGKELYINSSTAGSTKKFKITVDDSGSPTITNESDSTNTWKPTNLPTVAASDAGKFLRVSDTGEWVAETIPNASGVSF